MTDPIVKEITVAATPDVAFETFTAKINQWWPVATHSLSASDGKLPIAVTVTPHVGGAIVEQLYDGSKSNWGKITEWVPGERLAFTWHLRGPESEQTVVCIKFIAKEGATLVRLTHDGWDAKGDEGSREHSQYISGWDIVLGRYVAKVAA